MKPASVIKFSGVQELFLEIKSYFSHSLVAREFSILQPRKSHVELKSINMVSVMM